MLSGAIHIIEFVLYIYFAVCVGYIVIFSVASCFFKSQQYPQSHDFKRFAILIPAYKEDNVILDCIHSVLQQTYPEQLYDVIVVSDGMDDATNHLLYLESRITLLKIQEQESSKAKALRLATEHISYLRYDYVIILDADNLIPTDYLYELNKAVSQGAKAIQTHRKAKNLNSDTAILDAVIEEMNNTIFRKGHIQLGFSSALIGSGMVIDFQWFKQNIIHTHSAGEDKELEELLLSQGIHIEYADSIETLDEKVQKADSMRHQRRRWMATQLFLALKMGSNLPSALLHGNRDYLLKTIQTFILPRSILIAVLSTISLICSIISPFSSVEWWILFILLTLSLYIAIPPDMRHKYAGKIIKQLPYFTIIMTLNLFHLKGMANKFIHTQHGQL